VMLASCSGLEFKKWFCVCPKAAVLQNILNRICSYNKSVAPFRINLRTCCAVWVFSSDFSFNQPTHILLNPFHINRNQIGPLTKPLHVL